MKFNWNNPKTRVMLYILGGYFVVVLVVLFMVILAPSKEQKTAFKYQTYTQDQANEKFKNLYATEVCRLLTSRNCKELYNYMEPEFLKANNINSIGDLDKYLAKQPYYSNQIKIGGYQYYYNDEKNIYRIQFTINRAQSVMNIIETSPYNYKVSFGDKTYEEKDNQTITRTVNGIKFEMVRTYKDTNQINFDVNITNVENDSVEINFIDVTRMQLITQNDYQYKLSNNDSTADDKPLSKGSSVTKSLVFYIPAEEQSKIKYFSIADVKINGVETDVLVPFQ